MTGTVGKRGTDDRDNREERVRPFGTAAKSQTDNQVGDEREGQTIR